MSNKSTEKTEINLFGCPKEAIQLEELGKLDQLYRKKWTKENMLLQKEVDLENLEIFEKIVKRIGWPTVKKVGTRASYSAIMIGQHNASWDLEKSAKLLDMALASWKEDSESVDGSWLTNWIDLICLQKHIPQVYGQYFIGKFDVPGDHIYDIEDPGNLNKRRKKMGLEPYEEKIMKLIEQNPENRVTLCESYKIIFGKDLA